MHSLNVLQFCISSVRPMMLDSHIKDCLLNDSIYNFEIVYLTKNSQRKYLLDCPKMRKEDVKKFKVNKLRIE